MFNIAHPLVQLNRVEDAIQSLKDAKSIFIEMDVSVWIRRCDAMIEEY